MKSNQFYKMTTTLYLNFMHDNNYHIQLNSCWDVMCLFGLYLSLCHSIIVLTLENGGSVHCSIKLPQHASTLIMCTTA